MVTWGMEKGDDGWTIGYLEDSQYHTIALVVSRKWAEAIIASRELYETAMELPGYTRLPPVREVITKNRKRRHRV